MRKGGIADYLGNGRHEIGPCCYGTLADRSVSVATASSDFERRERGVIFTSATKEIRLRNMRISLVTLVPFDLERPNQHAGNTCRSRGGA